MSQECSRNRMNVSSKLEAACFFSVLVTWVYIFLFFILEIMVKSKDDKLYFSALLFFSLNFLEFCPSGTLAQTVSIYLFTILLTVEWHNGVSSHKLNEHKRKAHTHRV